MYERLSETPSPFEPELHLFDSQNIQRPLSLQNRLFSMIPWGIGAFDEKVHLMRVDVYSEHHEVQKYGVIANQ